MFSSDLSPIVDALRITANLEVALAVAIGSIVGIFVGAMPGLTFTSALALMLPFTFVMEPMPAIALLLAVYIGGMTGGSITAILIGIPGTPSAAAVVLDGQPLARSGQAPATLGAAVLASGIGGVLSIIVMMAGVGVVSRFALHFGPVEIFALVLFGLATICSLAGRSLIGGLIAGVVGLMLTTIGFDAIDGVPRLTFGVPELVQGVNLIVALVGLFALPSVIDIFSCGRAVSHPQAFAAGLACPPFRALRRESATVLGATAIGTGIGAIPGSGGPIAAFLAYEAGRRLSPDGPRFGTGVLGGVIAPEAANNAVIGGALLTLLALGLPGDPATAVIQTALLLHGIVPGPTLLVERPEVIYGMFFILLAAYLLVLVFVVASIPVFARILMVEPRTLGILVLLISVIGVYSIRNSYFDIASMIAVGLIGYLFRRLSVPTAPIVLGLVLGPILEREFRTALILSDGNLEVLVSSPTALAFYGLALTMILVPVLGRARPRPEVAKQPTV